MTHYSQHESSITRQPLFASVKLCAARSKCPEEADTTHNTRYRPYRTKQPPPAPAPVVVVAPAPPKPALPVEPTLPIFVPVSTKHALRKTNTPALSRWVSI